MGPTIADQMGCTYVSLWSWVSRRGMPIVWATKLAEAMEARAMKLISLANRLRALVADANRAAE